MVAQSNQGFIQPLRTDLSNADVLPTEKLLTVSSLQILNQMSSDVRFKYRVNPAIAKQRRLKLFRTVNHARIFWVIDAKPKGLLGGHLNIRSIMAKCDEMKHHFIINVWLKLCILTETSPSAMLCAPGYNIFRRDRLVGRGGGIMFYIKESIRCTDLQLAYNFDIECIILDLSLSSQMSFIVIAVHQPPLAKNKLW